MNNVGAFKMGFGILAIGIALGAFCRPELWAWLTLLLALPIVLGRGTLGPFHVDAQVKWVLLGLALLSVTAMRVPVREFFDSRQGKKFSR